MSGEDLQARRLDACSKSEQGGHAHVPMFLLVTAVQKPSRSIPMTEERLPEARREGALLN